MPQLLPIGGIQKDGAACSVETGWLASQLRTAEHIDITGSRCCCTHPARYPMRIPMFTVSSTSDASVPRR